MRSTVLNFSFMRRLLALGLVWLLVACSSDKPRPAPLQPVLPLLGVRQAWTASLENIDFPLAVRVVGQTAYLADSTGTVVALDAQTGADVWRTHLAVELSAGVGSDGRYTAVVSRDNVLMVLDGAKLIWQKRLSALTLTAPLVAGARVFTVSADRSLTAFDAANGRQLWQQSGNGDSLVLGQAGLLTAVGDTLVVGVGGRVIGVNPNDGSTRWDVSVASSRGTNEVERLADVVSGFYRDGDQLCVRAFQYAITCLDAHIGKPLWSKPASGGTGVAGDAAGVYGSESSGRIVSLARADGAKRWEINALQLRNLTAPLVVGKAVVVGDESGNLHFFSTIDGEPINRMRTDGTALVATPVMAGKALLAVSRGGGVFAFRSE